MHQSDQGLCYNLFVKYNSLTLLPPVFFLLLSADGSKINLFEKFFQEYHQSVKQFLDPDQAKHVVRADLSPNCLQKISADDTRRLTDNLLHAKFQF